jgi:hypothetical protein
MPKTIDPLLLLRDHIQQGKKITKQNNNLIFSDNIKLKVDTPTACLQSQSKKQYTLGSLWLYLKHRDDALTVYIKESNKEGIDTVKSLDKDNINDFFIKNVDDVEIIDQDLRPKTLIFLGKKKHGESFEKVLAEEYKSSMITNTNSTEIPDGVKSLGNTQELKLPGKKPRLEEMDPNLRVMDFIYSREKKSLNRNSILRPLNNLTSFENLLVLCKQIFTKNKSDTRHNETMSFLDELISGDDLKGNKAIIVVPSTYYPGNINIENAKQFLLNAV